MAIIVILCGAPHLYKKDMNNSGLAIECLLVFIMIKIQLYNISIAISLGIALSGLSLILDVFHNIRVSSCE